MSRGFGRLEQKIIARLREDAKNPLWWAGVDENTVQSLGRQNRIERQGLVRALRSLIKKRVLVSFDNGSQRPVWGLPEIIEKRFPEKIHF